MCDENIAVSIRNLSQESSIIPNRMDKIKIASLAAGAVAAFTTDINLDKDESLQAAYYASMHERVTKLASVIKRTMVFNDTWYESGAKTIAHIRNVFATGRRHPTFTLENVFDLVTVLDSDNPTAEASDIMTLYKIRKDVLLASALERVADNGLIPTLEAVIKRMIKEAQRITTEGVRLDILCNQKVSVLSSTYAAIVMAYSEPLPTSQVEFDNYYLTNHYVHAVAILNELVEKMHIDTDKFFAVYRTVLEARYNIAFEPKKITKSLLQLAIKNEVLAGNMVVALKETNIEELKDYIKTAVGAVYKAREDALERSVLHGFDFLPVNPIADLIGVEPETQEDISKRVEELANATKD